MLSRLGMSNLSMQTSCSFALGHVIFSLQSFSVFYVYNLVILRSTSAMVPGVHWTLGGLRRVVQFTSSTSTMERVPIELWEQILLKVMEMGEAPIFATSCTPYTFLYFVNQQTHWYRKPHHDYMERRRRLGLVCRTWNEFVLSTSHRWLLLGQGNAMYELDSTTTSPGCRGGVGPVETLSTTITSEQSVIPVLSWVSHILKRPANHFPLRAYTLRLFATPLPGYNPFENLLVGTTSIQGTNTNTNTNTALRSLSITASIHSYAPIALSQISRTFTGLRSLFLIDVKAARQQALTLPHLEVLYMSCLPQELETLQGSMKAWETPALRHVYLGRTRTPLMDLLDCFLGRYAHQIESLVLRRITTYSPLLLNLPSGFWAQFTELRLLGLDGATLEHKEWSGWSVVPPPTHPCRYLLCRLNTSVDCAVDKIHSVWTWHHGVRLVAGHTDRDKYYVVKNDPGSSITSMESNYGVLPEF